MVTQFGRGFSSSFNLAVIIGEGKLLTVKACPSFHMYLPVEHRQGFDVELH
jgi:hypothetical protein